MPGSSWCRHRCSANTNASKQLTRTHRTYFSQPWAWRLRSMLGCEEERGESINPYSWFRLPSCATKPSVRHPYRLEGKQNLIGCGFGVPTALHGPGFIICLNHLLTFAHSTRRGRTFLKPHSFLQAYKQATAMRTKHPKHDPGYSR